jgi:hypothetical protein
MRDYFLGYANSAAIAHATITASSTEYTYSSPVVTTTTGWSHYHYDTATDFYFTKNGEHPFATINHSHGVSGGTITSNYQPAHIKLAFIQFNKTN